MPAAPRATSPAALMEKRIAEYRHTSPGGTPAPTREPPSLSELSGGTAAKEPGGKRAPPTIEELARMETGTPPRTRNPQQSNGTLNRPVEAAAKAAAKASPRPRSPVLMRAIEKVHVYDSMTKSHLGRDSTSDEAKIRATEEAAQFLQRKMGHEAAGLLTGHAETDKEIAGLLHEQKKSLASISTLNAEREARERIDKDAEQKRTGQARLGKHRGKGGPKFRTSAGKRDDSSRPVELQGVAKLSGSQGWKLAKHKVKQRSFIEDVENTNKLLSRRRGKVLWRSARSLVMKHMAMEELRKSQTYIIDYSYQMQDEHRTYRGIINPEKTPWWPKWCAGQFLLLMYIGFIVPYRVCFNDRQGTGKEGGWYIFDFFVDMCLMVDTYMQLRKIRRDRHTNALITDFEQIKKYYKKSWSVQDSFYLDVLTSMPIHTVMNIAVWMVAGAVVEQFGGCIARNEIDASYCSKFKTSLSCDNDDEGLCKSSWLNGQNDDLPWTYTVAHYVRFVKLLRLAKFPLLAATFYNRSEGPIPSQFFGYLSRQIAEIGYMVLYVLHITVCIWYLVGRYDEVRDDGCLIRAGWVRRVQFRKYDSYSYRYTTAMYTMARGVPESASQTNFADLFYTELQDIAAAVANSTNTTAGESSSVENVQLTQEFLAGGVDVNKCIDIGPPSETHTGFEAGFLVIYSAASALLFGYIVAHMTSVISATNAHMFKRQKKLHELQAFFQTHHLPKATKNKLYKFYRDRYNHNTELNDYIFRELPHDISRELDHHLYEKFVHMRWWRILNMPSLPQAEQRFFCARLLPMRKQANEHLFEQGQEDESIYVIMDGQVRLSMRVDSGQLKAHELATLLNETGEDMRQDFITRTLGNLKKGDIIGEMAILYYLEENAKMREMMKLRVCTATAMVDSHFLFMSKESLDEVHRMYPSMVHHLKPVTLLRYERMAKQLLGIQASNKAKEAVKQIQRIRQEEDRTAKMRDQVSHLSVAVDQLATSLRRIQNQLATQEHLEVTARTETRKEDSSKLVSMEQRLANQERVLLRLDKRLAGK